jgi:hypothetical protein
MTSTDCGACQSFSADAHRSGPYVFHILLSLAPTLSCSLQPIVPDTHTLCDFSALSILNCPSPDFSGAALSLLDLAALEYGSIN